MHGHELVEVESFERLVVGPVVGRFGASRQAALHRVVLTQGLVGDVDAQQVVEAAAAGTSSVFQGAAASGRRETSAVFGGAHDGAHGRVMVATAYDPQRRVPRGRGVFAWTLHYRRAAGALIAARAVAAYRMGFDGRIHRFERTELPLAAIEGAGLAEQLAQAFAFYLRFADFGTSAMAT